MILAFTAVALSAYALGRAQRLKQKPAPPSTSGSASSRELRGDQKAAILLMGLPPDLSAELFKQIGPALAQRVTSANPSLPHILPHIREEVCREYMSAARQAGGAGPASNRSALQEVEELSRDFPAIAAKLMAGLWLK